jgi:HEPN domain-containing protein
MSGNEATIRVVHEWVEKAENDLRTAQHTLKLEPDCPTETVCFHAQQCVEKYLKAYLTFEGTDFPKTHDIEALFRLLPHGILSPPEIKAQRSLTRYAVATRYPGMYDRITMREARSAVSAARKVRQEIRGLLPKQAKVRMAL